MTRPLPAVADLGEYVAVPVWLLTLLHVDPASGINDYRRSVRGRDRDVDEALRALCLIATRHLERRSTSASGQPGAPPADIDATSSGRLTSTQAAARLGITPRQVRRLVAEGQLHADRPGYGWLLDMEEVEKLRARRAG